MHLEEAITLWIRAVWACKTSIFSCHPRRKTITFIQRDGQHLKSRQNRLNIHYLSSSPSLLSEKQAANTHPCFEIYREPVGHIDHLEPLFNFFIKVHFTQVFPLTCLQNTEPDYITFGQKMPQKLLMILPWGYPRMPHCYWSLWWVCASCHWEYDTERCWCHLKLNSNSQSKIESV